MSRRSLLLGGSALAFLAACGKKKDDVEVGDTPTTGAQKDVLSFVPAGFNLISGIDERVTFALFEGVPASLLKAGPEVKVAFQKPGTQVLTTPVVAERKSEGIEERPYYVVRHTFDAPGDWGVRAIVSGKRPGDAVITINDPAKVEWPTPGKKLPTPKTPTAANPMGVSPICTRSEGTCPFHAQSLDTLAGNNKPTVVLLATPALCQSATCGPVLDILMAEVAAVRDRVNVVHIEVFTDSTGKTPTDAFNAFKSLNEPMLYLADKSGTVTNRLNGGFDRSECRAALAQLVA